MAATETWPRISAAPTAEGLATGGRPRGRAGSPRERASSSSGTPQSGRAGAGVLPAGGLGGSPVAHPLPHKRSGGVRVYLWTVDPTGTSRYRERTGSLLGDASVRRVRATLPTATFRHAWSPGRSDFEPTEANPRRRSCCAGGPECPEARLPPRAARPRPRAARSQPGLGRMGRRGVRGRQVLDWVRAVSPHPETDA
jgi:hypothetical protein